MNIPEVPEEDDEYMSNLVNYLHNIRRQMRELQNQEKSIKNYIHQYMTRYNTNSFTTNYWICQRKLREREQITKDNVPQEIWEEYATPVIFPVLLFKSRN